MFDQFNEEEKKAIKEKNSQDDLMQLAFYGWLYQVIRNLQRTAENGYFGPIQRALSLYLLPTGWAYNTKFQKMVDGYKLGIMAQERELYSKVLKNAGVAPK